MKKNQPSPLTATSRTKFRWLLDALRRCSSTRGAREPRQLSLFYPEPPLVDQPWPCSVERILPTGRN